MIREISPHAEFANDILETAEKPTASGRISSRQEEPMLRSSYEPNLSDQDHEIFATLVSAGHYLRQVTAVVDFERYCPLMAERYHPSDGRPANDPVVLLKLCYLQTHYALSARAIISQAQVNIAFRFFCGPGTPSGVGERPLAPQGRHSHHRQHRHSFNHSTGRPNA